MLTEWLVYALAGVLAGTVAGLLGVGGGLIIVPVLVWLFSRQGMPAAFIIHMAVATSLMTIVVTSMASVLAHQRYGAVNWQLFGRLIPGLLLGALLGALLAVSLSATVLEKVFACFALLMAARMWLPSLNYTNARLGQRLPAALYGSLTGLVSALVGIGGGTMVVPYLVTAAQPIKQAIGTAAACGLPIALAGALGFMLFAPQLELSAVAQRTGLVYWPAFLGIVCTSVIFAPLGAKLAKQLPAGLLQQMFSGLLLLVAIYFFNR